MMLFLREGFCFGQRATRVLRRYATFNANHHCTCAAQVYKELLKGDANSTVL
jgi:hypothetical protein